MVVRRNPIWMTVRRTTYKKLCAQVKALQAQLDKMQVQEQDLGKTSKAFASLANQQQKPGLKGEGST